MLAYSATVRKEGMDDSHTHQDRQDGMTSIAPSSDPENKSTLLPELAVRHKSQTWSDQLPGWLASILEPKWSERLAAVSTSKDHASLPYWNEWVQEMSEQLWLHIKTASADLDLTSLPGTAVNTGAKLWFSMTKTCLPTRNGLRIAIWPEVLKGR